MLGEVKFADVAIWEVAHPIAGSTHAFKYRLALVVDDVCMLRFDNETGKGDHKHVGLDQAPYTFVSLSRLIDAFLAGRGKLEARMNTVTIGVSSLKGTKGRMRLALRGKAQGAFIGFASLELLWKVLTPKRWEIVRAMTGAGPMAIREIARRVERDVKSVHGDVQSLLKAGVVERADDGKIVFPYDEVHVDFVVRAA